MENKQKTLHVPHPHVRVAYNLKSCDRSQDLFGTGPKTSSRLVPRPLRDWSQYLFGTGTKTSSGPVPITSPTQKVEKVIYKKDLFETGPKISSGTVPRPLPDRSRRGLGTKVICSHFPYKLPCKILTL